MKSASECCIDKSVIAKLNDIEPGLDKKILLIVISTTPERINLIRKIIAEKDVVALKKLAHSIKSTANHLGARKLLELCKELESNAAVIPWNETERLAGELCEILECVQESAQEAIT